MNSILVDKDYIIYERFEGDQTKDTLKDIVLKSEDMMGELRQKGIPILIFVDVSKIGLSDNNMRKYAVEVIRSFSYNKIAIYGIDLAVKYLSNFIIIASGKGHKVKYFTNKSAALRWLKQL